MSKPQNANMVSLVRPESLCMKVVSQFCCSGYDTVQQQTGMRLLIRLLQRICTMPYS